MDMKNFVAMLLKDIEKSGLLIAEIKRIQSDKGLFAIETSDNSEFLIKIANVFSGMSKTAGGWR